MHRMRSKAHVPAPPLPVPPLNKDGMIRIRLPNMYQDWMKLNTMIITLLIFPYFFFSREAPVVADDDDSDSNGGDD